MFKNLVKQKLRDMTKVSYKFGIRCYKIKRLCVEHKRNLFKVWFYLAGSIDYVVIYKGRHARMLVGFFFCRTMKT